MTGKYTTHIMYEEPPLFGDTSQILKIWEAHLKDVMNWPDGADNKKAAIEEAQKVIDQQKKALQKA